MPCQDTPSRSSSRSIAVGPRPKRLRGLADSVDVPPIPGTSSPLPASDGLCLSFVVRPTGHVSRPSLLGPRPSRWSSTGYSPSYRPPSSGLLGVSPVLPAPPVPYRPPSGVEQPHPEPALQLRRPLWPPAYPDACPPVSSSLPTPAGIRPPLPVHVTGIRVEPSTLPASMSEVVSRTMTTLSRQWLAYVEALGSSSTLLSEASESHQPQQHLLRVIQKFAPSTLTRYFTEWQLWLDFARSQNESPSDPSPGTLPDYLSSRASPQGLCTGPYRALSWFSRLAGLPALSAHLQSSLAKSFLTATAPAERRESLPLPLSFVVWLERLVCLPATPPAEVLFCGTVLVCIWSSLRWGDALWVPPSRLQLLPEQSALVGSATRTKTTTRAMPFGLVTFGLSGTPSQNWAIRYLSALRQAVSDTLHDQPGRQLDFLPAVLSGPAERPRIARPLPRDLAVPRLLGLLERFWSQHQPGHPPAEVRLYGSHSCKATLLSWGRQLNLDAVLRRIQGHHRLSGSDQSVELYGRDDIGPMLTFQRHIINHVRAGFRPLQPLARGTSVPLPDFQVQLPAPLPSVAPVAASLLPAAPMSLPVPPPASPEVGPATTPVSPSLVPPLDLAEDFPPLPPSVQIQPAPASPASPASVSTARSDSPVSDPEHPVVPLGDMLHQNLSGSPPDMYIYNHRSNVVHAAVPATPKFLRTLGVKVEGRLIHFKPACGAKSMHLYSAAVRPDVPDGAQPCLRSTCVRLLRR